ncbi:MAG TPA: hypothetical protein DCY75_09775, partial [Clostridiales bacterium]|nr:hypothetical protein [Clostridiales bacterium]
MSAYSALAACYDIMNGDAAYEQYLSLLLSYLPKGNNTTVLDVGCGTGDLAIMLANCGFKTFALDLSLDMLTVAAKKVEKAKKKPFFIQQDMREMKVPSPVNLIYSIYDSMNYLNNNAELVHTFTRIYDSLQEKGKFVFDLNSRHRYEDVYKDNTFIMEDVGVFLSWENNYNPKTHYCDFYLHIFLETPSGSGQYRRSFETQRQRYFPLQTVKKCLKQ